jgi:hypothetical protein
MFIHRATGLIIPQDEHAKIVIHIAENWWNDVFLTISEHKEEFLEWVRTHDRAFWINDTIEIGWDTAKYTKEERIEIVQKWLEMHHSNTITDITVLHHLHQLCSEQEFLFPTWKEINEYIQEMIQQERLNALYHQDLQTVTWLCDNTSFQFCIWKESSLTLSVIDNFSNRTKTEITIKIQWNNIYLHPFPLKNEIRWDIIWYSTEWYPEKVTTT